MNRVMLLFISLLTVEIGVAASAHPQNDSTRFRTAAGHPIHEIRIRGNQKVTETEIRAGLEYGPEDISEAVDTLKEVLPYFSQVTLGYENDGAKLIAIIMVTEKALSSDHYIRPVPLIRYNRVTGWLLATRVEIGKRTEMGPLWMWDIPSLARAYLPKLFGEIGYGFGNRNVNYRVGRRSYPGTTQRLEFGRHGSNPSRHRCRLSGSLPALRQWMVRLVQR